jgi:hypothetical protein
MIHTYTHDEPTDPAEPGMRKGDKIMKTETGKTIYYEGTGKVRTAYKLDSIGRKRWYVQTESSCGLQPCSERFATIVQVVDACDKWTGAATLAAIMDRAKV